MTQVDVARPVRHSGESPAPAPAQEQAPVADLESVLVRPWWRLRLPRDLERAFQDSTALIRARRLTACAFVGVVAFVVVSAQDAVYYSQIAWLAEPMRWLTGGLGFLGFVGGAAGLRWGRRPPARALEVSTTLVLALVAGYIVILAAHADDVTEHTHIGSLLSVLMYNGIFARQPFRMAAGVGLAAISGYALAGEPDDPVGQVVYGGHLLLFGTGFVLVLLVVFLLENRERRAYVLSLLQARQEVALARSAEALRHQALCDPLTGLANRRHLDADLDRAWALARASGSAVAVLAVDVDHFKAYNDHYGHPAGDTCLARLALVFGRVAERHAGTAARVGGEEFLLLLPGLDEAAAASVADQVVQDVRALGLPHPRSIVAPSVTVSVGVAAVRPRDGVPAGQLLAAADAALYRAKTGGRDRWVVADGIPVPAPATTSPVAARPVADPPETGPAAPEADLAGRISTLLGRRALRLRFPADLEAGLWESRTRSAGWGLALTSAGGFAYCLLYVALTRPLVADLGGQVLGGAACLVAVLLALIVGQQLLRPGWRAAFRVATVAGTGYSLGFLWLVSASGSPTVYSLALASFLVPMFVGVVPELPFRHTLVMSLLVVAGYVVLLRPADAALSATFVEGATIVVNATLYSVVGSYLLERAARREYLLTRLKTAQLATLAHNTDELHRLATRDPLTGLTNRRGFEDEYARAGAACRDADLPLSLLILDVDHFKLYNDGYGHPAGDECLRRVGSALSGWAGTVPAGSPQLPVSVARLGGEEFGVLVAGRDLAAAADLAEQVRLLVRGLDVEHGWSPVADRVTISIGVATSQPSADGAGDRGLLADADAALYRAKAGGRDRVSA